MEQQIDIETYLRTLEDAFREKSKLEFLNIFNQFLLESNQNFKTARNLLIRFITRLDQYKQEKTDPCLRQWESLESKLIRERDFSINGISWFKQMFLLDNLLIFIDELFEGTPLLFSRLCEIYQKREEKINEYLTEYRINYRTLKESRFSLFLSLSV